MSMPAPLAFHQVGEGPPLVAVHGPVLAGRAAFAGIEAPLSAHHRLVVVDRPGYGRTGGGAAPIAAQARRLLATIDALESPPAVGLHAVGYDVGGLVLLRAAQQRPGLLAGMVLVSVPAVDLCPARMVTVDAYTTAVRAALDEGGDDAARRLLTLQDPDLWRIVERLLAREEATVAALQEDLEMSPGILRPPELIAALSAGPTPTTVLAVTGDRAHPAFATFASCAAAALSGRREVIAGAGHAAHLHPAFVPLLLAATASARVPEAAQVAPAAMLNAMPSDTIPSAETIRAALAPQRERRVQDLRDLVTIPSVSATAVHDADVAAAADRVALLLRDAGAQDVRLLQGHGGPPAVYGELSCADPSAQTVLLYAHYDVQPPFDVAAWPRDPFEPVISAGRMYGRGTADDKHGVVSIAWALSALRDAGIAPTVNVKILCEGEEEVGSPHLAALLAAHGDLLRADTYVIDDAVNARVHQPMLTATLRGLVDWEVTIRAMAGSGQHSGLYGGLIPDPRLALSKLIAGLTDDRGVVTVPGVRAGLATPSLIADHLDREPFDEGALRDTVGLPDSVPLAGDETLHPNARLWLEPALTVIGIDGPSVAEAANTIAPVARAKLSLRIGPGQDPAVVDAAMRAHLTAQRPLGLPVQVESGAMGSPYAIDEAHPSVAAALDAMAQAWGAEPTTAGIGGSIPLVAALMAATPEAGVLLIGAADATSNIHGIDESLDLADWEAATATIALLLTA